MIIIIIIIFFFFTKFDNNLIFQLNAVLNFFFTFNLIYWNKNFLQHILIKNILNISNRQKI